METEKNQVNLRGKFRSLVLASAFFFSFSAFAETIRLWDAKGEFVDGYGGMIYRMQPGMRIELREGQVVTILRRLGSGGTTAIFDIGDGRALRLPLGDGVNKLGVAYEGYITWFAEGAEKVSRTEAPIVKYYPDESWDFRFVVVEKLEPAPGLTELYSLEDLIEKKVPAEVAEIMTTALIEDFAPKTWQLRFVSDMWSSQLVYTNKGWVIADLTTTVRFAKSVRDSTLFSAMGKLPISWRTRLERKVLEARRAAELNGSFAQSVLSEFRRCVNWLRGAVSSI